MGEMDEGLGIGNVGCTEPDYELGYFYHSCFNVRPPPGLYYYILRRAALAHMEPATHGFSQ